MIILPEIILTTLIKTENSLKFSVTISTRKHADAVNFFYNYNNNEKNETMPIDKKEALYPFYRVHLLKNIHYVNFEEINLF